MMEINKLTRTYNVSTDSFPAAVPKKEFRLQIDNQIKIVNSDKYTVDKHFALPGILKHVSSFPRPVTVEDSPPIPIAERGYMKNFTHNRRGDVIPIRGSPWFVDQWFAIKAKGAIERLAASKLKRKQAEMDRRRQELPMESIQGAEERE